MIRCLAMPGTSCSYGTMATVVICWKAAPVTATATSVGAAPGDTFFGTGGSLIYSGIASVTLNMDDAPQGDTINVAPSTATAFVVHGGGPRGPATTGDSLNLDLTGVSG